MYLVVGANGQLGHELKLLLGENAVFNQYVLRLIPQHDLFYEYFHLLFRVFISCLCMTKIQGRMKGK